MKRKWFRALSLLLFLGVTACGGGGGGGGAPPGSTTGVWDSSTWDGGATWGS
jgi:hypothetical protein